MRPRVPRQPGDFERDYRRVGLTQVYAREGLNAFVTVRRSARTTVLFTGGKADASTATDMDTQLLLGFIPLLSAPEAEKVLVVGAGSGVTARVVSDHPTVKQVVVVEIEEAMVEAAEVHFADVNHDVFERDGVEIPADTWVLFGIAGANRDPQVYPDPERFDLERDRTDTLTFGRGVKSCPGMHLARRNMCVALEVLLERLGPLELLDAEKAQPRRSVLRSPEAVWVRRR